ncbi:MAG: DUF1501 domain-containing protein [Myxococcota bacterium]|nr:DUF1501 domain-containing protein [Myxococcota bacterium]
MWTRRELGWLGLAAGLAPRRVFAQSASDRHFLFIHARGGWDTSYVFAPQPGVADMEADSTIASVGGIRFTDHPDRPAVRRFFERHGGRAAVLNGMEVRSVTHERCQRILLTGRGDAGADDWPSILAAHDSRQPALPHLLLAGTSYNAAFADKVVRVGDDGQLPKLLSGRAFQEMDTRLQRGPSRTAENAQDAVVAARLARLGASGGDLGAFADRYAAVVDQEARLRAGQGGVDLAPTDLGCERDIVSDCATAFDCFERELARCAMVTYDGWCSEGWDTHQRIERQSRNFEDLFAYLEAAVDDLDGRRAADGTPLAQRTVICVYSEMGRAPRLNAWGGKDHWTFTSAMLFGAGVAGGQIIGALDDQGRGQGIDLVSGASTASGVTLQAGHLGATLLALGDVDPGDYLDAFDPVSAVLA